RAGEALQAGAEDAGELEGDRLGLEAPPDERDVAHALAPGARRPPRELVRPAGDEVGIAGERSQELSRRARGERHGDADGESLGVGKLGLELARDAAEELGR